MSTESRDHSYTIRLAEDALQRIKSLRLPGDPPSFELWYAYAGRLIPALNAAINDAIAQTGTLSVDAADEIYRQHFAKARLGERVERISEDLHSEIDQIVGMIDAAIDADAEHCSNLSNLGKELGRHVDREATRTIIAALVEETRSAIAEKHAYQQKLGSTRDEIEQLRSTLAALQCESQTDALTGLANRKQFDLALGVAVRNAKESAEPLTLLMCDIDHFKAINDTWGHPIGDDVLRLIGGMVRNVARARDVAARYGGEEFAMVLPDTSLQAAAAIAERLRLSIQSREVVQRSTGARLGRITVSIGLAEWQAGDSERALVERADACLYAAKKAGRNRIISQIAPANANGN